MRIGLLSFVGWLALSLAGPSAVAQNPRVIVRQPGSYLGVGVQAVTPERAKALNLNEVRGAEVTSVEMDSPAAKAGLKQGDVVLQYNGENVAGLEQFIRMVRETPAGRQVSLVVWRNGANQTLTVTVGERRGTTLQTPGGPVTIPNFPNLPQFDIPRLQMLGQSQMLGIEGESLGQEQQLAQFFGVQDGVLVKQVLPNSAAERAGIKAGDVITKVDGSSVASTRDITRELRSTRSRTASVTVMRDKKETTFTVNLEDRSGNPPPGQ
jgi:serine protease Do